MNGNIQIFDQKDYRFYLNDEEHEGRLLAELRTSRP